MYQNIIRKKKLSAEEKKILIEKISNILKAKEYIVFAYIFGSFASEDSYKDMDVGIFVSGAGDISPLRLELKMEDELEDIIHIPVDVRIINSAPLSFVYNILKNGIIIVDNNRSLRADFEGLIYKKYADFRYFRREYLREIRNAPV